MAEIQSWQRQNMSKSGGTGPSSMHSKITGNTTNLHSKIGAPTVRNYADGGMVDDTANPDVKYSQGEFAGVDDAIAKREAASGEWARGENYGDGTTGQERVDMAKAPDMAAKDEPAAPRKQSFKEAFAENRKAGNATFEFEGKKFTTELAKPAAQAPREAKKTESPASVVRKPAASAPAPKTMTFTNTDNYDDGKDLKLATGGSFGSKANTAARPIVQRGKGVIDTSNIDSKTLLPKR